MKIVIVKLLKKVRLYDFAKSLAGQLKRLDLREICHKRAMIDFYSNFISGGDLCFDIGANIGNRTDVFLKLGATVVAVEPQAACMEELRKKYGTNKRVILINKGLGEKKGEKIMRVSEDNTISSMSDEWISAVSESGRFQYSSWDNHQLVFMTTLDDLIANYGKPVFCKIDVEGYELPILKGLSQPIPYISFEFVPEIVGLTINCINHLSSLGNARFNYSIGESMKIVLLEWVRSDEMCEILKSLPDKSIFGDVYVKFN